jgi:glyoxylase-like metal-dependent hydrolase (beta-lactamase superfamily II)
VIVEDDNEAIFLAGDTSYTEATMLAGQADGVSPDQAVTRQTLAAIRQFASTRPTVYLPAHDPDGGTRFARRQAVSAAMGKAA